MAGGLLNIVAYGNQNVILNGNPSKTFFKTTYAKYTNFGLQKFRIDFQGQKTLHETRISFFNFTIPRYADLLVDTYFVIDFPNIWSPIYVPGLVIAPTITSPYCQPYEFKWIQDLGAQLIKKITISVGGMILQELTGQYLYNMVKRDFSKVKQDLFNEMTGNVPEMNDPANFARNNGNYPSVLQAASLGTSEPSILARRLYIPLNLWYMLSSSQAFPLLSVGENQLKIQIECRPVRELFVVRDMAYYSQKYWCCSVSPPCQPLVTSTGQCTSPWINFDVSYAGTPYISTMNLVDPRYQMYLFLTQEASDVYSSIVQAGIEYKENAQSNWYADPHLMCTYAFLGEEERQVFRTTPQTYLLREVHEYEILSNTHRDYQKIKFSSVGLVANWMWYFQRSDVNLRNEWSNYTNWKYKDILPFPVEKMYSKYCISAWPQPSGYTLCSHSDRDIANPNPYPPEPWQIPCSLVCNTYMGGGGQNFAKTGIPATGKTTLGSGMLRQPPYFPLVYTQDPSGVIPYISGPYQDKNNKYIMTSWMLWCDGKLRENQLEAGILDSVEKYARSSGGINEGLYFYNFGLNTDPRQQQPTGAMNLNLFKDIEFEFTTLTPPADLSAQQLPVCDGSGNLLGINKIGWNPYIFNYNLYIIEERYNLLTFENGKVWLKFTHHR
jgi:hypothetical protein